MLPKQDEPSLICLSDSPEKILGRSRSSDTRNVEPGHMKSTPHCLAMVTPEAAPVASR
jgi:hypothetical protein